MPMSWRPLERYALSNVTDSILQPLLVADGGDGGGTEALAELLEAEVGGLDVFAGRVDDAAGQRQAFVLVVSILLHNESWVAINAAIPGIY
jgi:hypothetical protein